MQQPDNSKILLPSPSKYFIFYSIISQRPGDERFCYLVMDDGRFFASKVEAGTSLKSVIDREVVDLTGSPSYEISQIVDNYDTAPDRYGKMLPRSNVILFVPYFEPGTAKTRFPMKWTFLDIKLPNK